MVFKHNEQPFDHDDSCQLAFKHMRQLNCSSQLAISACRHSPERRQIPDGVRPGGGSEFENMTAATPTDNSGCAFGNTSSLSWVISTNGEIVRSEHSKRPFSDEQSYQVSKRTRQVDGNIPPFSRSCEGSFTSVTADEEFKSRKDAAVPEDFGKNSHGSIFSLPWFTCSTSEEDARLEPPVRLSFFPGYYEDHHHTVGSNQLEETHSPVFDCPPRKLVALGPNHQADVPVWRSKCSKNSYGGSDGHDASTSSEHLPIDEDNSDKWTGSCVMPMSDSNSLASEGQVRCCKIDCRCLDEGSIRCVRQHVREARERLRSTLGHERFVELGFCEMGEDTAQKWTEEEEQLCHEVVLSNPASLGKNIWDDLPQAFPTRSSKELVSYYFNVFMLRKRAEQNRSDPLNIDSDNDECQESDDGEFAMTEEEDEDSGVESPTEGDDVTQNNGDLGEVNIHEEAEEGDDSDDEDDGVSDGFIGDNKSKFGLNSQPMSNNLWDGTGEDQDIHDDSCTSYEGQYNGTDSSGGRADVLEGTRDSLVEDDHENLHAKYRNDGMSGLTDPDYIVGHCDLKPWDIGYIRAEKDLDFLPTCNVIEEVFGNESWENETRDSHRVS